ncbi:DUF805 domain-containing protein [Mammaliicoccus sciuri]|uniref:DUF805 domain-containing protein n=1 Tax=Mammaliicoccus sciuri TaxID=1296 RepID=UPI0013304EB1|nr:DUF805 domain-containing protein [Mammaliicoccus sciuri]MCJ1748472.1 DUF805 domain-containing protein [Mammaliicoccus sciuri]
MLHYYKLFWLNAFNIHGRSRRKEFWYPILATIIITMLGNLLIRLIPIPELITVVISFIFNFATFIASISVTSRRFHDLNMTMTFPTITYAITFTLDILYSLFNSYVTSTTVSVIYAVLMIICFFLNLAILIMACGDGHKAPNKYGESPKYA